MTFQLLDERSRVRHLLDSTITTYKHLLAAIANLVLEDKFMIDDFENSATHLLMHDPVSKRRSAAVPSNTDQLTHVWEATASLSSFASDKVSRGKFGLDFRFYNRKELMIFSQEQRDELIEFRKNRQGNNDRLKSRKKDKFNDSNKDSIKNLSLM